jgi:bacillithiol biosynthesis deacetylase BshB1
MNKSLEFDVVAVGAHPDDAEIGCGGTIASLTARGYRVAIVDLTDGEPTPSGDGPEQRLAEASAAARILGAERETLDLPNRRLFDGFEARVALAKVFRRLKPKVVLGIAGKTPLASPDHWQASQITDAAIFYARLSKWDHYFDQLPVHKISKQLYYPLFETTPGMWAVHQLVVDITNCLQTKIDAVRCYRSQFPPEKEYLFERITSTARVVGAAAGIRAGEMLYSPAPLGTSNLMHSLFAIPPEHEERYSYEQKVGSSTKRQKN